jgi:hypothetical protein
VVDCLSYAPPDAAVCDGSSRSMARAATGNWYTPLQDTIREMLRRHPDGLRLVEVTAQVRADKANVHTALVKMQAAGRVVRVDKKWRLP